MDEKNIKKPVYIGDLIRYNYVKKFLKKAEDGKLLDVGAGQCEYKEMIESKGYKYFAIDTDSKSPAQRGDICNIPFSDGQFDVLICIDVLEHVEDHKKAVSELKRVLRENGTLIIHIPNKHQRHILIDKPEEQHDHVREGYDPVEINTLFFDFSKVTYYPTFDRLESVAWDLMYAIMHKVPINPMNIITNDNWTNYGWLCVCKN